MEAGPRKVLTLKDRNRIMVLGIAIPTILFATTLIIVASWWRDLPNRVAIQWSASTGEVTNTISRGEVFFHVGAVSAVLLIVPVYFATTDGSLLQKRVSLGVMYVCTISICGAVLVILDSQRGGQSAVESPSLPILLGIFSIATVLGVLAGAVGVPRGSTIGRQQ